MAHLSHRELQILLRLAQQHGRLVHRDPNDDAACAEYDDDVAVVQRLAGYGLVTRPLLSPDREGRGAYRACLAPITERGRAELRLACATDAPAERAC